MKKNIKSKRGFIGIAMGLAALAMVFISCGGGKKAAAAPAKAGGTNWPTRQIQLVVPYSAGGDTDFHARTFAKYAGAILGKPIIITNMPGGNGSIGTKYVRDAKPDGYTALLFHDSMVADYVGGVMDYYAPDQLAIVGTVIDDNSYIWAVNSKSKIKNLKDVETMSKKKPGSLIYLSQVASYSHFLGRTWEKLTNTDLNIVDAGGGTSRNAALLAQKGDINCNPYGIMKPYIDSGDMRAIATLQPKRNPLFPKVPTAVEQGYNFVGERWYFVCLPKNTPKAIVDKFADALKQASQNKECIEAEQKAYVVTPVFYDGATTKKHLDEFCKALQSDPSYLK